MVVSELTGGLAMLAKQRKVEVVRGSAQFVSPHVLEVERATASSERIRFEQCIIAAGSEAVRLPFLPRGSAHHRFHRRAGAAAEAGPLAGHRRRHHRPGDGLRVRCAGRQGQRGGAHARSSCPAAMPDLVRPLEKRISARYGEILLDTRVTAVTSPAATGCR